MKPTPSTTGPASIVTSLEWAKKLKEAGWPQEQSLFSMTAPEGFDKPYDTTFTNLARDRQGWRDFIFAAPTSEEILRQLPEVIEQGTVAYFQDVYRSNGNFCVGYYSLRDMLHIADFEEAKLSDAAAACYCYLAEQNLLPKL